MNKKDQFKQTFIAGLSQILDELGYQIKPKKEEEQRIELSTDSQAREIFNNMGGDTMPHEELKKAIDQLEIELTKCSDEEIIAKDQMIKFLNNRTPDAHTKQLYDSHGNFISTKVNVHSLDLMVKRRLSCMLNAELAKKSRGLFIKDFVKKYPQYEKKIYATEINRSNELLVLLGKPLKVEQKLKEEPAEKVPSFDIEFH